MIFRLVNGGRRKPKPVPRKPVRLWLETLETRDCPSPTITSFSATPTNAPGSHQVELKGTVSDANPSSVSIQFSGVATGVTMANSNGAFDFLTNATSLGQVEAVGKDMQGSSAAVWATLSSPPPVLTSFVVIAGPAGTWTFEGHVNDPEPQGTIVTFNGPAGVNGKSTNVDASGDFQVTWVLGPLSGGVSAFATDVWGQLSNTIYDPLA